MLHRFRARPLVTAAWILALAVLVLASLPLFGALAQRGTSTTDQVIEDFSQGHVLYTDRLTLVEGFKPGDKGWYLAPHSSGRLVYRVPRAAGSSTGVNLWLDDPPGGTDFVLATTQGQPAVVLASNVQLIGDRVSIPIAYASAPYVDIEIDATNSGDSAVLVVDQLVSVAIQGTDPKAPPVYSYLAFGGLAGALAVLAIRRRAHAIPFAIGMGVVAALAAASRILPLFVLNRPLDPDALGYRLYAARFQWWPLFDNGIFSGNFGEREPLFPMVVHAYFQVLGASDFHLRVVSATLSIAVVIMSVVAARRRLVSWWGPIVVGLLVATSGPLILESYRGLRLELEALLVLTLYVALDRAPAKRPLLDALLIGVLGAAMVLTRTYFIPVFGVAVAISFLARYRPLPRTVGLIAVGALIMGGAATAHRIGMFQHHNDPFWDTAGYSRWNANMEYFAFHRPLPHAELFPTAEDYAKYGPYFGPHLSTAQYLFVIHSPAELARDSLAGSREIFDTLDSYSFSVRAFGHLQRLPARLVPLITATALRADLAIRWLVLIGLAAMLIRAWHTPRLLILPAIGLTWLGMTAFLFDHALLERYRHTWQTFPLAMIAAAWLVEAVVIAARRRFTWKLPATGAVRIRPTMRGIAPLLTMLPVAVAILFSGGRPSTASIEAAGAMLVITAAAAVAFGVPELRSGLLWLLASIGPIGGVAYVIAPQAPTAAVLAPAGAVVGLWLYLQGHRWALVLGLLDLAIVLLIEPLALWLGVALASGWLLLDSRRFRSNLRTLVTGSAAAVLLVALAAGASLAATTPAADAAWSIRLSTPDSHLEQLITVDRAGDSSIWIYGLRSSTSADYPFRLDVNGAPISADVNPSLPTEAKAWSRVALPAPPQPGDHLDVVIAAGGQSNPTDRYLEIGGVFAKTAGLDSPGVNGTYLVVLGDDSRPLAPGGLPEPLVQSRWQPPLGEWMPGERFAPPGSRDQASTLDIWAGASSLVGHHPLGLGTGHLAAALYGERTGLGPGLSARSQFLQAAAEWGIGGLAALLLVIAAAAWFAVRSKDRLAAALLIMIVISMVGTSFLLEPAGAASTWLVVGMCLAARSSRGPSPATSRVSAGETPQETSQREAIRAG